MQSIAQAYDYALLLLLDPPLVGNAAISTNGLSIVIPYDKALDETSTPATTDYSLLGTAETVSVVTVNTLDVTLTIGGAITALDVVRLHYTQGSNPLQSTKSILAHNLSARTVINNSTV